MADVSAQESASGLDWLPSALDFHAEHAATDNHDVIVTAWESYAREPKPALTLLGGYDSGKSSLLRRLLVDAGLECPEWLTISARHETFETGAVEFGDLRICDTPGVSADADDPRSAANNERALAAAALTDALLVVLPPQLATAEIDIIRQVVDRPWPAGALRFCISRFDEAGVDPTGDLDGYHELAARKAIELRRSLNLPADVPIAVVAPDPFQLAGDDRQPDPVIWDSFRPWDGMSELASDLLRLPSAADRFRAFAARRYWTAVVRTTVSAMSERSEELARVRRTEAQAKKRLDHLLERLGEVRRVTRTNLDRVVGEVLNQSLTAGVADSDQIMERMRNAVGDWARRSEVTLSEFLRDAEGQIEEQTNRPNWADIESLLEDFGRTASRASSAGPKHALGSGPGEALTRINNALKSSLEDVKTVFLKRTKDYAANASKPKAGPTTPEGQPLRGAPGKVIAAGEVVLALGPLFVEATNLFSESRRAAEAASAEQARHDRIEKAVDEIGTRVSDAAFAAFESGIDEFAARLREAANAVSEAEAAAIVKIEYVERANADAVALIARIESG